MKTNNIIQTKSYAFAVRIIKTYQFLGHEKKEYVVSKQLLRCGTSVGANVEEAIGGQSRKDFFAKLSIAYKEAREAHYWIQLLKDTGYLTVRQHQSLLHDAEELLKIIGSIQKQYVTPRIPNSQFEIRNLNTILIPNLKFVIRN